MTLKHNELFPSLTELAMDLHWTWNHSADKIWRELDPVLWELTHNPLAILQTVSRNRINQILEDPIVQDTIAELITTRRQTAIAPAWFQKKYPATPLTGIAYFSLEFMLSETLAIYSGGLGNVAGDHLKAASDTGVPVMGIGLLYQQGYPRQVIKEDGTQQYVAPFNDPGQLPITPLRLPDGEWLRIEIKLPGYSMWLRTWKVQVGRVSVFLLDSNDAANFPGHRGITNELYGGNAELRLAQEIILGIGGWRLLKAIGVKPEVCHLNEGHSGFVILERALDLMQENNQSFEVALNITRSGNVFTTHTAVGAGFDLFEPALVEKYLGSYINDKLKISLHDFLALGRKDANDTNEKFNIGFLAVRGCGYINGVSKLHGKVSRQLFANLFPRWPAGEVPIGHITNGVHMPTWDSAEADKLWTESCGKDRWLGSLEKLEQRIRNISDARLWTLRKVGEAAFIEFIRDRYKRQLATIGRPLQEIEEASHLFDPEVLTLGFARRFTAYKRPDMLLYHQERLRRILLNREKPVQLILAGKAHPGDGEGQAMIREWIQFINSLEVKGKAIFLGDYDMILTEELVQGVDLWINTPRRPWEACGTSGMKVLVNGGINLSELDGWWDEAYSSKVGWALGDRNDHGADPAWDRVEAQQLYDLLEQEIIPEFYNRNKEGIPEAWVNRMRESMAQLTPLFSANRSLQEYLEKYYLPAAAAYKKRAAEKGKLGKQIVEWKTCFAEKWKKLYFGSLEINKSDDQYFFFVQVYMGDLQPGELSVELYADGLNGDEPIRIKMEPQNTSPEQGFFTYAAKLPAGRPETHYTPRIIPNYPVIAVPLECSLILWYH